MTSLGRRAVLALGLAAVATPVLAQDGDATAPIVALNAALLGIMKVGRSMPFAQRAAMLLPAVQRAFDLATVLRSSVGPRFAEFPSAQQAELLEAFTEFTVANYVANFSSYSGEKFNVSPQTRQIGNDQVVHTEIVPTSGDPTAIDYVMRRSSAGWHAVDVLLDGSISRVAVQRSDFRELLSGGSAAPLIASLRKRSMALAARG